MLPGSRLPKFWKLASLNLSYSSCNPTPTPYEPLHARRFCRLRVDQISDFWRHLWLDPYLDFGTGVREGFQDDAWQPIIYHHASGKMTPAVHQSERLSSTTTTVGRRFTYPRGHQNYRLRVSAIGISWCTLEQNHPKKNLKLQHEDKERFYRSDRGGGELSGRHTRFSCTWEQVFLGAQSEHGSRVLFLPLSLWASICRASVASYSTIQWDNK